MDERNSSSSSSRSDRADKRRDVESRCCILVREIARGSAVREPTGLERDAPPPPEDVVLLQQCRRAPAWLRRIASAGAASPTAASTATHVDLRVCERHVRSSVRLYRERDPKTNRWTLVATASAALEAPPIAQRAKTGGDDGSSRSDRDADEKTEATSATVRRRPDTVAADSDAVARPTGSSSPGSASRSARGARERCAALEEALRSALDERNAVGTLLDALRSEHLDAQQQAEAAAKSAAESAQRTRDDADAHCKTTRAACERQLDEMRAHANRLQADCEMLRHESDQKSDMLAALLRENVRHRADLDAWPVTHADRVREVQEEAERQRTQLLERLKKSRDALYDAEQRVQALEAAADELHAVEAERSRLVTALRKKIAALEDAADNASGSTPSSSRTTTPRASASPSAFPLPPSSPVFPAAASRVPFGVPGA